MLKNLVCVFLVLTSVHLWSQSWSTPVTISNTLYSSNPTGVPPIQVDAGGNAFTIWASIESSQNVIRASRFDAISQTWSAPELIGSDNASDVHAVATSDGKVIAIWTNSASTPATYFNIFDGSAWQGEQTIDLNPSYQTQFYPKVAIDGYGRAVVVWQVQGGNLARVIRSSTYFFDTNTWSTPTNISTDYGVDNQYVALPIIAINDSGRAIAIWVYQDTTNHVYKIQDNIYTGSWLPSGNEETIVVSMADTTRLTSPKAAVAPNGNILVLWAQYDGTTSPLQAYTIKSSVRNLATEIWSSPIQVSGSGSADINKIFADIACDQSGDAVGIWLMKDEGATPQVSTLQATTFPQLSWASTVSTISDTEAQALICSLALSSLGDGFATWTSLDSQSFVNIQTAQYVKKSNTWKTPQIISGSGVPSLGPNQISGIDSNSTGKVFAVWFHEDPSTTNIFVQGAYTSIPPMPPSNFKGVVVSENFLNNQEYILEASWLPSPSSNVILYRIYKNTTLIADISANQPSLFVKLSCSSNEFNDYQIAAVDSNNQESDYISLQVLP